MQKKIILFLVEGSTDVRSLALPIRRKLKKSNCEFYAVKTDLTTEKDTTVSNIERKIKKVIQYFLSENPGFKINDIKYIIQIADTDGAFVDNSLIKPSENGKTFYTTTNIFAKSIPDIIERNKQKSEILRYLSTLKNIGKSDYKIYYMSCNLEHVLHNLQNVDTNKKVELADKFLDDCDSDAKHLIDLLDSPNITNSTSYKASWEYIQQNSNSLKRKSNLSYFFTDFKDLIE